ncbi:MAG: type II secretion system protein [Campylobacterales bacterium]|nr:type II secretion system protein [Campylobacterales bacterium]
MRRNAFSMLELIFVIVVMGILAKFGVDLFKQIYDNYARTVIVTSLEEKTETALAQIANRLRERIPESARLITGGIEWIGRDSDGWNNASWSGVADIGKDYSDSNSTLIETPGTVSTYFTEKAANWYAVYFLQNDVVPGSDSFYTGSSMHPVSGFDTTSTRNAFTFATPLQKASEHYVVSEFAYKLVLNGTRLFLHKYKPWNARYRERTYLLLDNSVSDFAIKNFKGNAGGFIVVLCLDEPNLIGEGETKICKQKFVF